MIATYQQKPTWKALVEVIFKNKVFRVFNFMKILYDHWKYFAYNQ